MKIVLEMDELHAAVQKYVYRTYPELLKGGKTVATDFKERKTHYGRELYVEVLIKK